MNATTKSSLSNWVSVPAGKGITAIVMFLSVFIVILLPIFFVSRLNLNSKQTSFQMGFKKWVGRLSCFAAGVFLSTGFLDIFPDVIKAISEAGIKLKLNITYPLASFFTLLGFFMILSIEQLIFIYNESIRKIHPKSLNKTENDEHIIRNESKQTLLTINENNDQEITESNDSEIKGDANDNQNEHDHILDHSKSRIITLMSAISVHAIFEGFAIGLGTTIASVTELFLALSLHKLIIAASLGLNLATVNLKLWFKFVVALIFSLGSPLGIIGGIGVMKMESNGNVAFYMVGGALQGLACGTFLYVVFFEILPHELGHHSKDDRCGKLTGLILGFILVCLYLLLLPES